MPGNSQSHQDPYSTGGRDYFNTGRHQRILPAYTGNSYKVLQNAQNTGANSNLSQLISLMFGGELAWNGIQMKDWNKEVMSAALQQMLTNISNQYNEQLRDEQRVYDNPLNQLNRLTGAGVGRDAAIQILSGAGATGEPPYSTAGNVDSSGSPSESVSNAVNSAATVVSMATGLVNMGMSANLAYKQAQFIKTQNQMSQNQLQAYLLSGDAYRLLQEGERFGVVNNEDGHLYDNVQNVAAALEDMAKAGDVTAQDWHATGKIDELRKLAPYAAPILADFYKQSRAGSDHDIWFNDEHAKTEWLNKVNQMTVDSLAAGVAKTEQEIRNLVADENWRTETIKLIDGQLKLWDAEGENSRSSAKYQRALARKTQLENLQTSSWMNGSTSIPFETSVGVGSIEQTGLELFTTQRLQDLKSGALTVLSLNKGEYWKKNVNHMFNDVDNLITLSLLNGLKSKTSLGVYNNLDDATKQLIGLSDAYQSAGVFDYLQTLGDINRSTTTINTPIGTKTTNSVSVDVLNSINFNHLPVKPSYKPIILH